MKGYTNIRFYDMENEPYGWWSFSGGDWAKYSRGFVLLHQALVRRGIRDRIKLDCNWNSMSYAQLLSIRDYADLYDEHQYGTAVSFYDYASAKNLVLGVDPTADGMVLGETGIQGSVDYGYAHTSRDSAAGDAMGYDYGW